MGLKEMFKLMDTDNSRTITFDELKAGLCKLGTNVSESEVRLLMEAVCLNPFIYLSFLINTALLNNLLKFQSNDVTLVIRITVKYLNEPLGLRNGIETNIFYKEKCGVRSTCNLPSHYIMLNR